MDNNLSEIIDIYSFHTIYFISFGVYFLSFTGLSEIFALLCSLSLIVIYFRINAVCRLVYKCDKVYAY